METIFQPWVSKIQREFIGGRSFLLLSNVIDIDTEMRLAAVAQEDGACIFYDFRAASPSIDQSFMLELMEWIGIPPCLRRLIAALYRDN
eukprot:2656671-Pyramimonas_sp.AAC.1